MASRNGILAALKYRDEASLVQSTKELSHKATLGETITSLSRHQLVELWDTVQSMLVQALKETEEDVDYNDTGELLHCVTKLAFATLTVPKGQELFVPPSMFQTAVVIHGILPSLTSTHQSLKEDISRLFEHWWTVGGYGKEELVGNTLMYLLAQSTGTKATKATVIRLCSMRFVLDSINLDHENAGPLIDFLQRCCLQPQFNTLQGIKFLAYLFTLNPELTKKLHQAYKNQLPTAPASWHTKFGEIYFRAWQGANTPTMKEILEHDCIQDLMYRAVHASRAGGQGSMAKILFRVLNFFHKKKTQKGVESMLTRLYEPILWRSVKVANSDVRINAASLMFDIFPLQDAVLNREQWDAALQKQFDIMHGLLTDPVPDVRLTAINGVGRVLNIYWELIPADVIKCFITLLVEDLAYDISSPSVREAVLKVMYQLCDNHLCIPILNNVLPQLRNFVHDTSEKVRITMFDLLLKVKGLRAIKFWNIVPVEHILARLQSDTPPVVRRVMKLIQPSFLPLHQLPAEQINRCITLIKMNTPAARQFFLHLPHCISLDDTIKFIIVLCRALIENARKLNRQNKDGPSSDETNSSMNNSNSSDDSNISKSGKRARKINTKLPMNEQDSGDEGVDGSADDSLDDMVVFRGFVEAVYLMHTVILNKLEKGESLAKKLSVMVREVMAVSKDPKLDEALIALAGHIPSRALPHIAQNLFKKLKSQTCLSENINIKLTIKSLVLWGKAESVIQLVKDSFENLFNKNSDEAPMDSSTNSGRKSKTKKKAVTFVTEELNISPELALSVIKNMIGPAECRVVLLTNHRAGLTSLIDSLLPVMTQINDHFTGVTLISKENFKLFFEVYAIFLRLAAFLCVNKENNGDDNDLDRSEALQVFIKNIRWCRTNLLPHLIDADVNDKELASELLQTTVKACINLTMIGLSEMLFIEPLAELFKTALQDTNVSLTLKSSVIRGVYELIQVLHYNNEVQKKTKTDLITDIGCFSVNRVLTLLSSENAIDENQNGVESNKQYNNGDDRPEKIDSQRVTSNSQTYPTVISKVVDIILELTYEGMPPARGDDIVASVMQFVMKDISVACRDDVSTKNYGLPPLTASILVVFQNREYLKRLLYVEFQNYLQVNEIDQICQIQGILAILQVLKLCPADNNYSSIYKSLGNTLDKLFSSNADEQLIQDLKNEVKNKL